MNEQMKEAGKKMKINEKTINVLLILILGFLVGVAVKTEAKKRITIGYGDYLIESMKQDFDLMSPDPKSAPETQGAPNAEQGPEQGDELQNQ